jgi:hypothetical protein
LSRQRFAKGPREGGSSSPLLDVNLAAEPHFFSIAPESIRGRSTVSRFALLRHGNQGDGYRNSSVKSA